MSETNDLEGSLRAMIERAIREAALGGAAGRSARFVAALGQALHTAAQQGSPGTAKLIQASFGEFLWDIFIGIFGTAEDGSGAVLIRGLWAVEVGLEGDARDDFNKLMVSHVDQRLAVLPSGTRQLAKFERQCQVAKVTCWVAEVSPPDEWPLDPAAPVRIKLQHFTPRR